MKQAKDMSIQDINKEMAKIRKDYKEGLIQDINTPRYLELTLAKKKLTKSDRDKAIADAKLRDEWIKMNNCRRKLAEQGVEILSLESMKELANEVI